MALMWPAGKSKLRQSYLIVKFISTSLVTDL